MAQDGGLPELLDVLRWRWRPALLIAAAAFAGAAFYIQSLPSKYDGEAVVALGPRAESNADADTVRVVSPKYIEYVEAPSTIRDVAPRLGEDEDTLEKAVDANVATDTGNLSITVRLPSPERAARAANAFALAAVGLSRSDPQLAGQLVARAIASDRPAAPPRKLFLAAALLVSVMLGLAVTALLERARPRLRSWRDISKLTGHSVVGRIPTSRTIRTRPTEAFADPVAGSAFRTLRANLEPQLNERMVDTILVTSPGVGDGKSTVAALLAEAFARVGLQALLLDADLRRPRVAEFTGGSRNGGLSELLRDRKSFEETVQPAWTDGLWALTTQIDPEARDLLPMKFPDVLRKAREAFDIVVVDSPPLLGADDTRALAPIASGVLLVVSAGETADEVNEAIVALESLRAPLLGIVGNRLKEARSAYAYY